MANAVEIRRWARENGFSVSSRGRLPESIQHAYRDAAMSLSHRAEYGDSDFATYYFPMETCVAILGLPLPLRRSDASRMVKMINSLAASGVATADCGKDQPV